jgi:hypothetical protein
MSSEQSEAEYTGQPLKHLSIERLRCLLRHWSWADEARTRFERELASFPSDYDRPAGASADRPIGAYYHWCALLCALGDAADGHNLTNHAPLDTIHDDLRSLLPWLRVCRKSLFDVPASPEPHPTLGDLHRDQDTVTRLRRVHRAFGDAFRNEQVSRDIDALDL